MNHTLWNRARARVLAMAFLIATATACGERLSDVSSGGPSANPVSPSAQLVGVPPAPPQGDPPGTTPVEPTPSTITKQQEVAGKPHEGDNHAYSSVAEDNPQKAQGKDPQQMPERTGDGRH